MPDINFFVANFPEAEQELRGILAKFRHRAINEIGTTVYYLSAPDAQKVHDLMDEELADAVDWGFVAGVRSLEVLCQ